MLTKLNDVNGKVVLLRKQVTRAPLAKTLFFYYYYFLEKFLLPHNLTKDYGLTKKKKKSDKKR